jgi:type III pantothenate kinase
MLLIDAGNTRIKWALIDDASAPSPAHWRASGSVAHAQIEQLQHDWRDFNHERALISNVAGPQIGAALQQALPAATDVSWFASVAESAGVRNAYRNPAQLGCDRFASAIGAHALLPGTALVIATCGTATTIDALTAEGVFIGGMILPGLGLMASSLARNTAQLPQVAQDLRIAQPFADHTDAAIVSGCLAAQAGAIERAVTVHGMHGPVRCVLSGGAATLIAPHLQIQQGHQLIENLVLLGLHTVARSRAC